MSHTCVSVCVSGGLTNDAITNSAHGLDAPNHSIPCVASKTVYTPLTWRPNGKANHTVCAFCFAAGLFMKVESASNENGVAYKVGVLRMPPAHIAARPSARSLTPASPAPATHTSATAPVTPPKQGPRHAFVSPVNAASAARRQQEEAPLCQQLQHQRRL